MKGTATEEQHAAPCSTATPHPPAEGAAGRQKPPSARADTIIAAFGTVLCVVFIPLIILNSLLIISTYTNPDHLPNAFGISPLVVLSGSMSPTFESGALVFIQTTDVYALEQGDIICYLADDTAVTHRIQEISEENGEIRYLTKGDANNAEDSALVAPSQIEGIYRGSIPNLGNWVMTMQTPTGMLVFIVLPIVLYLSFDAWRRSKEAKAAKAHNRQLAEKLAALEAQATTQEPHV